MRLDKFKTFVLELLDCYRWSDDEVLRKKLGSTKFLQAFLQRCQQDEEEFHFVFSDAVYFRIPREIYQLKTSEI